MVISGGNFKVLFHKETGDLASYQFAGEELLKSPLRPNYWRAMTDNDRGSQLDQRSATWREVGMNRKLQSFIFETTENQIVVSVKYQLPTATKSLVDVKYTINSFGEIVVDSTIIPGANLPEIPEVGMLFTMDAKFDNIEWYGKGPHENYWDKNKSAKIGLYQGKVEDQYVPYLKPQECGNKTEVRWATVTDKRGVGLKITGLPTVEVNVLPYLPIELEEASHQYKLPESDKTVVRVNLKQMGVGGDDSWGQKTHPEFTLYADQTYHYQFKLKPIQT